MTKIVASLAGNHGGSLDNCRRLIRTAKALGADVISLERYDIDCFVDLHSGSRGLIAQPRSQLYERFAQTYTPWVWWPQIVEELGSFPWICKVYSRGGVDAFTIVHRAPALELPLCLPGIATFDSNLAFTPEEFAESVRLIRERDQ